ncbi:MAG TPA: hypothetical protein VG796_30425 [Verrucomicrobiales bacterium]|jgi:hypothetical protein|nr:hypothetical protein [Verrucomicrobiales bacterium]
MKKTTTILAALTMGAVTALAGTEPPPPVSTGKGTVPPPMDPCAGPISYNNIEILYAYTDFDGNSDEGHGAQINIEYSPTSNFYLTLGGEWTNVDEGDLWTVHGGIGGYVPLTPNIHLAADGGALWSKFDFDDDFGLSDDDEDEWGWYVRPHLRAKWGCLTIHAGAEYRDVEDFEEWSGFAALYYQINPAWDLTAGVRFGEDVTTVTAGVRWRY